MPKRRKIPAQEDEEPLRKWRRVIIYSDTDESENSDSEQPLNQDNTQPPPENVAPDGEPETNPTPQSTDLPEVPEEFDAELLAALGDPAEDVPDYGDKIPLELAQRWLAVLRKGIQKEKKEVLLKEYAIPDNCRLLRAPTLNAEISAATSDISRARDKRMETNQNQLGLGITAVSRGLSLLLSGDEKQKKVQAIKFISDGCKILADLHFTETQARVKLITPGLDKAFLNILKDVERDETLFGNKLSEKIKASKAIEKQGLQIKKPQSASKSSANSQSNSATRSRPQGNWTGPSRYQSSNRGGRGAGQKYSRSAAQKTSTPKTSDRTPPSSSKQRAQTR